MISRNSVIAVCTPLTVVSRSSLMSLIITFMFEPAKLQMNWASASGARNLRRDTTAPADAGAALTGSLASRPPRPREPPRHHDRREMTKPAREVGDDRPPPYVVLIGESAGDREERLGGDGHHPDDLANAVKLEALARHRPRHGPDWTARMLAKLECVRPPFARVVFQRSYASAFAFSASNSCCVVARASSSSFRLELVAQPGDQRNSRDLSHHRLQRMQGNTTELRVRARVVVSPACAAANC